MKDCGAAAVSVHDLAIFVADASAMRLADSDIVAAAVVLVLGAALANLMPALVVAVATMTHALLIAGSAKLLLFHVSALLAAHVLADLVAAVNLAVSAFHFKTAVRILIAAALRLNEANLASTAPTICRGGCCDQDAGQ